MITVFLAHSSKDKRFARRLAKDLRDNGITIWIDEAEILVGDSLVEKLEQGIKSTDYLAVILSPASVSSRWVLQEVRSALKQEIEGGFTKVLPILYKPCDVPPFLDSKVWADFSKRGTYQIALSHVLKRLGQTFLGIHRESRGPWPPKIIRLGLSVGLLVEKKREIVFADHLEHAYCLAFKDAIERKVPKRDPIVQPLLRHLVEDGHPEAFELADEDLAELLNELNRRLLNHAFSIGVRGRILHTFHAGHNFDEEFHQETAQYVSSEALERGKAKRRGDLKAIYTRCLTETIRARLLAYDSRNADWCYPLTWLALIIYDENITGVAETLFPEPRRNSKGRRKKK